MINDTIRISITKLRWEYAQTYRRTRAGHAQSRAGIRADSPDPPAGGEDLQRIARWGSMRSEAKRCLHSPPKKKNLG